MEVSNKNWLVDVGGIPTPLKIWRFGPSTWLPSWFWSTPAPWFTPWSDPCAGRSWCWHPSSRGSVWLTKMVPNDRQISYAKWCQMYPTYAQNHQKPSKTIKNHQKPIEFNRNFEKPGSGHFWTMKLLMFAPIGADVREVRHSHHCPKCLGYSLYALWCLLVQIRERTGEQKWSRREEKCHWDKARFPGFWKVLDGSGRLEGSSGCWFYKMFTDRNDRNAREGNNNMLLITSFVIEFWIKSRVASNIIKPNIGIYRAW